MGTLLTHSKRALVIDDHAPQRFVIAQLLRRLGFSVVHESANAEEASRVLTCEHEPAFDLVVSDLQMPYMDGVEFVRRFKNCPDKIPALILMSSHTSQLLDAATTLARSYGLNVLGGISKPVSLGELEQLLAKQMTPLPVVELRVPKKESIRPSLTEMRYALSEGQFVPYFQPKLDLDSGRIIGAEMLARWEHPIYGLLGPVAFDELFEDVALCTELTHQLVLQAFKSLQTWRKAGHDVTLAINLTWPLLQDIRLADRMIQWVNEHELPASALVLEVTESVELSQFLPALDNMVRLRLHGFGLALDDFGTGYSNLQILSQIPLTQVKIDRSLVHSAAGNPVAMQVLSSVVELSLQLDFEVVAEGIERPEDLALVSRLGCHQAQGFLVGRPMSAVNFYRKLG